MNYTRPIDTKELVNLSLLLIDMLYLTNLYFVANDEIILHMLKSTNIGNQLRKFYPNFPTNKYENVMNDYYKQVENMGKEIKSGDPIEKHYRSWQSSYRNINHFFQELINEFPNLDPLIDKIAKSTLKQVDAVRANNFIIAIEEWNANRKLIEEWINAVVIGVRRDYNLR